MLAFCPPGHWGEGQGAKSVTRGRKRKKEKSPRDGISRGTLANLDEMFSRLLVQLSMASWSNHQHDSQRKRRLNLTSSTHELRADRHVMKSRLSLSIKS